MAEAEYNFAEVELIYHWNLLKNKRLLNPRGRPLPIYVDNYTGIEWISIIGVGNVQSTSVHVR